MAQDYISALTGPQMDESLLDMANHNSEAWAIGKRKGVDVPSSDETYHNNSKYYSTLANASAQHPPIIQTGSPHWWIWDNETQSYVESEWDVPMPPITATGILKNTGDEIVQAIIGIDYGYPLLKGEGAPLVTTEGLIGQHYLDTTATIDPYEFVCISASIGRYIWVEVGGSSGGTSPSEVMNYASALRIPETGELEDTEMETGSVFNEGSGWQTCYFKRPFSSVPKLFCAVIDANAIYGIQTANITTSSFQYKIYMLSPGNYNVNGGPSSTGETITIPVYSEVPSLSVKFDYIAVINKSNMGIDLPRLKSLSLGFTISPTFNQNTFSYTASMTASSSTVLVAPLYGDSVVEIKVDGNVITNGSSVSWTVATHTVGIKVTKGYQTSTYTVTVTRTS